MSAPGGLDSHAADARRQSAAASHRGASSSSSGGTLHSAREPGAAEREGEGDGAVEEADDSEEEDEVAAQAQWEAEHEAALASPSTRARSSLAELPAPIRSASVSSSRSSSSGAARGHLRSRSSKSSVGGSSGELPVGDLHLPVAQLDPTHVVRQRLQDPSAAPHLQLGHPSNHLLSAAATNASMLAVFELLLHFDTFTNIDLFKQGLYFLRAQFFTLGGVRVDAQRAAASAAGSANGAAARSVAVGAGAADSGSPDSDLASLPRNAEEIAALQSQISQWEAAVHDLNALPPKSDREREKELVGPPTPSPTSESVMSTLDSSGSGVQLCKAKVALPYYQLQNPADDGDENRDLFAFADKAVYPPSIQDTTNHFHSRTFRIQYCEQEVVLNDACLFRLELNARRVSRHARCRRRR